MMARIYNEDQEFKLGFASRMQGRMDILGLSRMSLSAKSGLVISTIDNYLHAHSMPTGRNITRIAEALECTTDYLLGVSETPQPEVDPIRLVMQTRRLAAKAQELYNLSEQMIGTTTELGTLTQAVVKEMSKYDYRGATYEV